MHGSYLGPSFNMKLYENYGELTFPLISRPVNTKLISSLRSHTPRSRSMGPDGSINARGKVKFNKETEN